LLRSSHQPNDSGSRLRALDLSYNSLSGEGDVWCLQQLFALEVLDLTVR
jgi:hypothetical protein